MAEPDASRSQITFSELVRNRRLRSLIEWQRILVKYVTDVLAKEERLRFNLGAGQRVYEIFGIEMQAVSAANQPFEVYLDPARNFPFKPFDCLVLGMRTMETVLIRIDFTSQPDFDTNTYNRLRLEHVLTALRQSC